MRASSPRALGSSSRTSIATLRLAPLGGLRDADVRVGEGGDLRQVRDDDHLPVGGDLLELAPDRLGRAAAQPGVDLVEDVGQDLVGARQRLLDRQHDARQLAARGDLARAAAADRRGWARTEAHAIGARRRRARASSTVDGQPRRREAQLAQRRGDLLLEAGGRLAPRGRERRRPPRGARASARSAAALRAASASSNEPSSPSSRASASRRATRSATVPPCLRQRRCEQEQPLLDLGEARRIGADAARVAAEIARDVLDDGLRARAAARAAAPAPGRGPPAARARARRPRCRSATAPSPAYSVSSPPRRRGEELLGALEPLALGAQLVVLARGGARRLELAQLEAQQVLALGARARVGRERSRARAAPRRASRSAAAISAPGVVVLGEGVQDGELAAPDSSATADRAARRCRSGRRRASPGRRPSPGCRPGGRARAPCREITRRTSEPVVESSPRAALGLEARARRRRRRAAR